MQPEALSISVYGAPGSIEYQAATSLCNLIRQASLSTDKGTISLHTDVYFPGGKREQIDLLLHAYFPEGLIRKIRMPYSSKEVEVTFQDIIAVIEVKAHRRENVIFSGVNAEVLYDGVWKSASSQSHAQVHSVKPFLAHQLGWKPWVCNLIFFSNLNEADLPSSPHNYLASDSSFQDVLGRLCLSRKLNTSKSDEGHTLFSCIYARNDSERKARNEQLRNLLRTQRDEVLLQPPSDRGTFAQRRYWHRPAIPQPIFLQPKFRRMSFVRKPFVIKTVLSLLFLGGLIQILTRTKPGSPINSTAQPIAVAAAQHPILRTCAVITPSCGCDPSTRFRKGKTIYVQFMGKQQRPASEVIHDPQGKTLPLSLHHQNLSSRYFDGSCFVARHTFGEDAVTGSYFVQASATSESGHPTSVLSQTFQVVP
jgi:hypothetical protein